jgi:hypothetical protein
LGEAPETIALPLNGSTLSGGAPLTQMRRVSMSRLPHWPLFEAPAMEPGFGDLTSMVTASAAAIGHQVPLCRDARIHAATVRRLLRRVHPAPSHKTFWTVNLLAR